MGGGGLSPGFLEWVVLGGGVWKSWDNGNLTLTRSTFYQRLLVLLPAVLFFCDFRLAYVNSIFSLMKAKFTLRTGVCVPVC